MYNQTAITDEVEQSPVFYIVLNLNLKKNKSFII